MQAPTITTPAPADAVQGQFSGFVEVVGIRETSGWCCNTQAPGDKVVLELSADGVVLGTVVADLMRADLLAGGIGDGRHAFCWTAPRPLSTDERVNMRVRVQSSGEELARLPDDGATTPELGAAAASELIIVDGVSAGGATGWIRDDRNLSELTVDLLVDGICVGSYPADIARGDVAASGLDSGRFGFRLPLPDDCFGADGVTLTIAVPALGVAMDLAGPLPVLQLHPHGYFAICNGLVEGHIDCHNLPADQHALIFFANQTFLGAIPIPAETSGRFVFQFEIPLDLSDGALHRVSVALDNSCLRLRSTTDAARIDYQSTIKGRIDTIDEDGIEGWVYSLAAPDEPIELDLYDGNVFVAKFATEHTRADVNQACKIKGSHGFRFSFPVSLYDGVAHSFRVLYKGEPVSRKKSIPYPLVLSAADLAAIPPARRYLGRVDGVSTDRISGWAVDLKDPATPVQMSLYVDDQFVGTTYASRFEVRLRTVARSGHHVFLFRLPPELMNGRKRAIKVVVTGVNHEMPNPIGGITFPLVDVLGATRADALPNFTYAPPLQPYLPGARAPSDYLSCPDGEPLISIIVLNLNGAWLLRDLFESFLRIHWRYSYELLLVDHGSTDGSLELAAEFAQRLPIRVLARGANYSFAASNNFAAQQARGKILALANNDLVMLHDCLAVMADHLRDPEVGAVGLKLLEPIKAGPNKWQYITHHQGVNFAISAPLPGTSQRYYVPMEIGEDSSADLAAVYQLPITTGALMLCRATDFADIGGFFEGYFYGMEDVDLCLGIVQKLGKKVVCDTAAVALHNRSATRDSKLRKSDKEKMYSAQIHAGNRALYLQRFGRQLTRTVLKSLVAGDHFWRPKPLRVVFAVTDAAIATPAGDLFTAMELGEAMRRLYNWDVLFVSKGTYSLPGADVLIVMLQDYKIEKIVDANPGLVTVAWARNWLPEWCAQPYLGAYQLIFCSSQKAIDYLYQHTGRSATLLPIATNAQRFAPCPPAAVHMSDLTFTGSYWLAEREAIGMQNLARAGYEFAIYGYGWDQQPQWEGHWRGSAAYTALPEIYSSAKLVLDDSHPVTREWNSLNSRVFDALACGRLVLTNCAGGARELFPDLLPNFDTPDQLQTLIEHYLAHPQEREALAAKLQQEVLRNHTYDQRAHTFHAALTAALGQRLRFAIKIGVPTLQECDAWGDYHFALGIKLALEKRGHFVRIDILPDWYYGPTAGDDVVIVLRGLSQYQPQPTTLNLMWLISHPDEVKLSEYKQYDHVFIASEPYAEKLQVRLGDKVSALLQCTNSALFHKDTDDTLVLPDLLFVGNSRGQRREGVQFALESNIDFGVYGEMWDGMLPARRVHGKHIANDSLRTYYSSAKVVLNDHWPDMRDEGFISNRIFDAGACGAAIVTDDMSACRQLFGDTLAYYNSSDTLAQQTRALIADPAGRKKRGAKLSKLILSQHTFDNRADTILQHVERLNTVKERP